MIMKKKTIVFYLLLVLLLMASFQLGKKMSLSSLSATSTSTQVDIATGTIKVWTPTRSSELSVIPTLTPMPVFSSPTSTLPPITPITPPPLVGVYLDEIVLRFGSKPIELSTYHFDKPLEITGDEVATSYSGVWSWDRKYMATGTAFAPLHNDSSFIDLGVCILKAYPLWETSPEQESCIRLVTGIPLPGHPPVDVGYTKINNISWSPDNKSLMVTIVSARGNYGPCLIDVETGSADCDWATSVFFNSNMGTLLRGAHTIAWSPQDEHKFAIPLKKNWYPIVFGVKNGQNSSAIMPWDISTGDLQDGLYILDTTQVPFRYPDDDEDFLTLLWSPTENTTINHEQFPLWTSDGKKIAFVYMDPWNNIESSQYRPSRAEMPFANYVVGLVQENNGEFENLFDSQKMYMSGVLPTDTSIPTIFLHQWIHEDRFLLFTATVRNKSTGEREHALFLFDLETKSYFQVTKWEPVFSDVGSYGW